MQHRPGRHETNRRLAVDACISVDDQAVAPLDRRRIAQRDRRPCCSVACRSSPDVHHELLGIPRRRHGNDVRAKVVPHRQEVGPAVLAGCGREVIDGNGNAHVSSVRATSDRIDPTA